MQTPAMALHRGAEGDTELDTQTPSHAALSGAAAQPQTSSTIAPATAAVGAGPDGPAQTHTAEEHCAGLGLTTALTDMDRDGFHVLPQCLTPAQLCAARAAFDARFATCTRGKETDLGCNWTDGGVSPFLEVLLDEGLLRLVSCICGLPFVAMRLELFQKGPQSETVLPWHQDTYTTHMGFVWTRRRAATASRPHPVTLWVALDDMSLANGGMEMVPGRHREILNGPNGAVPDAAIAGDRRVEYRMAAGQAGLHHPLAPHRSGPNTTSRPRRTFLFRFSPWTATVGARCGTPAEVRAAVQREGRPQWSSRPAGRYVWMPGNADAVRDAGPALSRMYVCFEQGS